MDYKHAGLSADENPLARNGLVDIVIVNWNSGRRLAECLGALQVSDAAERVRSITIVDNGSTDGSAQVPSSLPGLRVVGNSRNAGFAVACNQGARQGSGEFILFLNPDVRLEPSCLRRALGTFSRAEHQHTAVVGVCLLDEAGSVARSCVRFPSSLQLVLEAMGVDRYVPAAGYRMRWWAHDESAWVNHVIGAFYLVRRAVFEGLAGFDESYFLYYEDLDFSLRASQQGWRCWFTVDARAVHVGGGCSRSVPGPRLFYSWWSRREFCRRHCSVAGAVLLVFTTLTVEPLLRVLYRSTSFSWRGVRAVCEAYGMFFVQLVKTVRVHRSS